MSYSYVGAAYAQALTKSYSPTAGNTLLIEVGAGYVSGTVSYSLTDNKGTTYNVATATTKVGSYVLANWYLQNCPAGITSFTVSVSGGTVAGGNEAVLVAEYSSLTGAFIGSSGFSQISAPGTSADAIFSGNVNVTSQPAAFIGIVYNPSLHPCTAGTSPIAFTQRFSTTGDGLSLEDARLTSTGNAAATFTTSNSGNNFFPCALAFVESSAASTPTITSVNSGSAIHPGDTGIVFAGSGFGTSQGTGSVTLVDGSNTALQTVTTWNSDSSITVTIVQGNCRYGSVTAQVTNNAGHTGSLTVTLSPVAGTTFTNITTPRALTYDPVYNTPTRFFDLIADLSAGDQIEVKITGGSAGTNGASSATDGTFLYDVAVKQVTWRRIPGTGSGTWSSGYQWDSRGLGPKYAGAAPVNQVYPQGSAITPISTSGMFTEAEVLETPLSYSISQGTLPTGLSINSATGSITGTPSVSGTQSGLVVRATNADLSYAEAQAFSIQVTPVTQNVTFSGQIQAQTATTLAPFTLATAPFFSNASSYSATGLLPLLPSGLKIDPHTGIISGIPLVAAVLGVQVTGANGNPSSANSNSFSITITAPVSPTSLQPTTCGAIDIYDQGNGSVLVFWPPFGGPPASSFNIYVNGVLNQNVAGPPATIVNLQGAAYTAGPPPVQTAPMTFIIQVVSVFGATEGASSDAASVTVLPTSVMLVTPMKRIFPFPNSGLD